MSAKKSISLALFLLFASSANAQVCMLHDEIVSRLESGYQEKRSGFGAEARGGVFELFTSDKGTWTIVATSPNGASCLVASGDNWEFVDLARTSPIRDDNKTDRIPPDRHRDRDTRPTVGGRMGKGMK